MVNVCTQSFDELPNLKGIFEFVNETINYLFPGYFEEAKDIKQYKEIKESKIKYLFSSYVCKDPANLSYFLSELNNISSQLDDDADFFVSSDPACEGKNEVILSYPGFRAIIYYRIAHIIYNLHVQYIPRIISEKAHSLTGIDIHPGAQIESPFFIDHGTGIVIGETSILGHHVKLYHMVTLGALSLSKGQALRGKKRHPTIGNFVTIYSGASILGGETKIGDHVTIGSNVFVVNSILDNTKIIYGENNLTKH